MFSITRLCIVSILSMLASSVIAQDGAVRGATEKCILQKVCSIDARLQCDNAISFGSAEINRPGGFVITQPGYYCLREDVTFNPVASAFAPPNPAAVQAAITIRSSNVFLDLGPHTLRQAGTVFQTTVATSAIGTSLPVTTLNVVSTAGFPTSGTINVLAQQPNGAVTPQLLTYNGLTATSFLNVTGGTGTLLAISTVQASSQVPYVIGILIPDVIPTSTNPDALAPGGLQSIHILGDDNSAVIQDFSMIGIRVFGHTYDTQMRNLTIKNCGALASLALRPFPSYIPHSTGAENTAFGSDNAMQVGGLVIGESRGNGMGPVFFTDGTTPPHFRTGALILENVNCINNFYLGIFLSSANDVTINNCHFDDTWSDQPNFTFNSVFFFSRSPNGGYFIGGGSNNSADGDGVVNMVVSNSTFNRTQLRGDFLTLGTGVFAGAQVYDSRNCMWQNCQFNSTSNTFLATGATSFVAGFLSGGMVDTTFTNCSADGTRGLAAVNGFHISGNGGTFAVETNRGNRNTRFVDCTARDIQQIGNQAVTPAVTTGAQAVGYVISFATDVVLENCIASDVIVNGAMNTAGQAIGYRIFTVGGRNSENMVLRNCIAQRSLARNGGQAEGFLIGVGGPVSGGRVERNIVFDNCVAEDSVTFPGSTVVAGTQSIACGFLLQGDTAVPPVTGGDFPWSLSGCKALRNKGVVSAVVAGVTQYSAGFYFLGSQRAELYQNEAVDNIYGFFFQTSDRNAIRECRADNNQEAGTNIGGGFFDIGPAGTPAAPGVSTSSFEMNRAFANGNGTTHDGVNGNYNIIYNAAPLVWEPLLEVDLNAGTAAPRPINGFTTYFASLHNTSTIN